MIDISHEQMVFIGRRGENNFRELEFDVSELLGSEYTGSSLHAIFRRPDGISYPVVTSYADGVLTWSPSSTDTIDAGVGRLEVRVVVGETVGKSVSILAIIEEALADNGGSPPDPPAQEWINQILSALSELDLDEVNNMLNSIYALLNTTHDLITDTSYDMYMRTGVLLNHLHPIETATAPDLISRRASITFTGIANGNNVVIGTVIYTFVNSLSIPTSNNIQILIQGTLRDTVKILAKAVKGIDDEINIAYGTGAKPNPACTAYWTCQRFSIGDTTLAPGESLFILEKAEDATNIIVLSSTAAATINTFTRSSYLRYIMSGNVSGSGGVNSIRGPFHTVLPINSVVIGGQAGPLNPVTYDCHLITLCRQSDTSEKELDFYISNDEETFTRISRSTPIGANSASDSLHIHIEMRQSRIPAGYGLYIRMGSDSTSVNAYCDLKFTYHLYPAALSSDTEVNL